MKAHLSEKLVLVKSDNKYFFGDLGANHMSLWDFCNTFAG